jgi:hypothetical protein
MGVSKIWEPAEEVHPTLTLHFQPRAVDCLHCPCLETYARKQCRITGEYIVEERAMGIYCPLSFTQDDVDKITKENFKYDKSV